MPTNVDSFFNYADLPPNLQEVSKPVTELFEVMSDLLKDSPEKSTGMRKLLEAKDCFVRAKLQEMQ